MTRDIYYPQFWYTGVVLITKLEHYFTVLLIQKHFGGFEMIPNPVTLPLYPQD